jgi:hypothetical protein
MKKGKILIVGLIALLMAGGLVLMGCESSPNPDCPAGGGSSCNTFTYCGEDGCAAYTGALNCNCK